MEFAISKFNFASFKVNKRKGNMAIFTYFLLYMSNYEKNLTYS